MNVMHIVTGNDGKQNDNYTVSAIPEILKKNRKVAIITADNTEDMELFYPYYRLTEEGYTVDVVTPKGGRITTKHGLGFNQTKAVTAIKPSDYELLYIPGGKAPAELRRNDDVLKFTKKFAQSGKAIAAICHGPQVLVSAGLAQGKEMAAWPEIASEIREAGGAYVNEALVIDGQFITGRKPGDLPQHLYGVIQYLHKNEALQHSKDTKASAGA